MRIGNGWRLQSDEMNVRKLIFVSQFCCRFEMVC